MAYAKKRYKRPIYQIAIIFIIVAVIAPFTFLKPIFELIDIDLDIFVDEPEEVKEVIEQPLHNVALPDFASIRDVKMKKRAFFAFIKPAIEHENQAILTLRKKVLVMQEQLSSGGVLSIEDKALFESLSKKYRIKGKQTDVKKVAQLLKRIDIIPTPLVMVQAANESAWGTSRFARIGLNFFGIWCYRQGCGMVPSGRNEGANHEVEAFKSVDAAIKRYLHNINTNNAYGVFRTIRSQLREHDQALSPQILATGLLPYSERGMDYVLEISDMIRHNQAYFGPMTAE